MPMGVLTHPLCTLDRFPIDMSENFPTHMSAESPSNTSPNPSFILRRIVPFPVYFQFFNILLALGLSLSEGTKYCQSKLFLFVTILLGSNIQY